MTDNQTAVVFGGFPMESGHHEVVYGPYVMAKAKWVARQLSSGSWHGFSWEVIPVGDLPGENNDPAQWEVSP